MSYRIGPTCAEILARAYYGLDLIGSATYYRKGARLNSIRNCLRLQWIDADHRITEQGLRELRRALSNQPNGIRAR